MVLKSKLLDEKVANLAKKLLKKVRNNAYVSRKLQAVIAAKESSITAVARICKISRTALTEWIKHLKFERIEKLFAPSERCRKTILNKVQRKQVEAWIQENPNITIKEVKIKILNEFGLNVSKSTAHREMQKMKFSYVTPRPVHYKQDAKNKKSSKKNLNKIIDTHPKKEVFFFDESRFGTHSKTGHGRFKKGIRTQVKVKTGREISIFTAQ